MSRKAVLRQKIEVRLAEQPDASAFLIREFLDLGGKVRCGGVLHAMICA